MRPGQLVVTPSRKLPEVKIIESYVFEDFRGKYRQLYDRELFIQNGVTEDLGVESDISVSSRNVLRGIHGDPKTEKLVSCLHGAFYLVVVNCREGDPLFGVWDAFTLSESNCLQILVPAGYGNAHLVMTDWAIYHYSQSQRYKYDDPYQFTYRWNDPRFKIWWPIDNPILSQRDQEGHYV